MSNWMPPINCDIIGERLIRPADDGSLRIVYEQWLIGIHIRVRHATASDKDSASARNSIGFARTLAWRKGKACTFQGREQGNVALLISLRLSIMRIGEVSCRQPIVLGNLIC